MKKFLAGFVLMISSASAATITLNATSVGWWTSSAQGSANRFSSGNFLQAGVEYSDVSNDYFIFDLTGISGITGATLRLQNRFRQLGYDDPDIYELVDVNTPIANLTSNTSGFSGFNIWLDLASGSIYGAEYIFSTYGPTLDIPFGQEGLDDLNAANRPFAIGGFLFSALGVRGIDPEAFQSVQFGTAPAQLILTTTDASATPEPGTVFGATGALGLLWMVRRRRKAA